jgi:phage terminase large subunit
MQAYNAENIKSLEDYDIAWVEEAQSFSERSLRLLRPTIRKLGSEIWFSWNPRHETDAVDRFFRGGKPRDDAALIAANWNDNPWFPEVLRKEKDSDYAADPEMAEHVWGGGYERVSEASYYGRLIALAEKEGRIGDFPYDPRRPVKTAWDIGIDDYTSIWFIQDDGIFPTVVDYYEATDFFAQDIVKDAFPELGADSAEAFLKRKEIGRAQPFFYAEHFMPHDVKHREWGAGRTRPLTLMTLGIKPIHVGAALGPAERINAVRQILPVTRFNRTPRVMLGISRLRRYSRKLNVEMGTYVGPLHDINSHGADAFGEYAVNCHFMPRFEKPEARAPRRGTVFLPGPPEPRSSKRIAT